MHEDEFWSLIDQTRAASGGSPDTQATELTALLGGRSEADLLDFARLYREHRTAAFRWDVWAAGYVIDGGMSNDSFVYFRDWLISRGRDIYERALREPDSLASVPEARQYGATAEMLGQVMYDAYERACGRELPPVGPADPAQPAGRRWQSEEELQSLVPRLYARCEDH